jgi:hypothetical protein
LPASDPVERLQAIAELHQFQNRNIQCVTVGRWVAATDPPVERIFRRPDAGRLAVSQPVDPAEKPTSGNASGLEGLYSILVDRRA